MKRFKNILMVYNDSVGTDDALTQAALLAQANGARLTLVDTCPLGQRTETIVEERNKRLARVVRGLQEDGIGEVVGHVLVGIDYEAVIRQVLIGNHDIVIASSDGGGGFQNTIYGSLAVSLMRKCPCPVWIVKPGQVAAASRVMAAVDLQPNCIETDPPSIKIIEMASSLAVRKSAELHVIHAWEVEGRDASTLSSEVPDATRERLLAAHEGARRMALSSLINDHAPGIAAPVIHLPRGACHRELSNVIDEHAVDLVVMGAGRRSSLSALLLGDVAEPILQAARRGVLTVKPDGFEVPFRIRDGLRAA